MSSMKPSLCMQDSLPAGPDAVDTALALLYRRRAAVTQLIRSLEDLRHEQKPARNGAKDTRRTWPVN